MTKAEYMEWSQKAKAMTQEQQRVFARSFDTQVLLEELWNRSSWLEEYFRRTTKMVQAFSVDHYQEGEHVENKYIRQLFFPTENNTPIEQKTAVEQLNAMAQTQVIGG